MRHKKLILFCLGCVGCINIWSQKNPCNPTGVPYSSLPADTTITLPGGTQLTFNRCEFFDLRDCLEFDELFDQQSIETAGFTTQDRDGNILLSCGMIRIRLSRECNDRICFEVPVKVRMPFKINFTSNGTEDTCGQCTQRGIRLYISDGGAWSDSSNLSYNIIDAGGQKYFEFYVTCPAKAYNCDCPKKGRAKVKLKAAKGTRLDQAVVRSVCPVGVLKFYPKKPKRRITIKLPCPAEANKLIISATGTTGSGEAVQLGSTRLDQLDHSNRKRRCKEKVIRRILGIFPVREGSFYKKYFIK